jgi:hypothetical protein
MLALGMALDTVRRPLPNLIFQRRPHLHREPTFPKTDFTLTCFPKTPKYAVL